MNTIASAAIGQHQQPVVFDRSYTARVEDLWFLWTTREGFASWWGPEGFRVEVRELDLRVGGKLVYDMIADGAEQIAFMKASNMPLSHGTRGVYTALETNKRLELTHTIDFIPGMAPYDNKMEAVFSQQPGGVARMVITVQPHTDPEWTSRASAGMTSQLTKVEAALARLGAK